MSCTHVQSVRSFSLASDELDYSRAREQLQHQMNRMATGAHVVLVCLIALFHCGAEADHDNGLQYRPGECLRGDKHKELACPEPETAAYQACFQWSNETCCTAEFTEQLAGPVVSDIDGFRWAHCDQPLSPRCHDFFVSIECFYRCSPNVAHWLNTRFDSAFLHLPVCREFCEGWFNACASDLTCATNWITDWIYLNDGQNICNNSSACRNFTEVYGDARGLCNTLWGESFAYSDQSESDPDRQCMTISWSLNQTNPNEVAIRNIFNDLVDTVPPAGCGGSGVRVWSALVILATVWAVVALV